MKISLLIFALSCVLYNVIAQSLPACPGGFSAIGPKEFDIPENTPGNEVDMVPCGYLEKGCSTGSEGNCKGPNCCSICQRWQVGGPNPGGACLGILSSIASASGQVVLTYTGGDQVIDPNNPNNNGPRTTIVTLSCGGSSDTISNLVYTDASVNNPNHKQNEVWTYTITGQSGAACGGGMGGGAYFLIILVVLIVVYLIAGVVFNKVRGASGLEVLPQFEFWKEVPAMFVEGIMFVVNSIRGKVSGEGYTPV
eukprot:TRINITY_DN254_c0_g2_i1.p1 TRINITY_DN254_c0_g2~~TRINITY_DN254_c0_g2_i1.p1  ORF type:complete len:252 (-),score=76.04 TRINITY_DN254_c0_g2_i1:144-899(-)